MFLPVVLFGRYGWAGVLAFAIPNVLGCAAFGYVLSRDRATNIREAHQPMLRCFSLITIAYHVYFLGFVCWLLLPLDPVAGRTDALWLAVVLPPAALSIAALLSNLPTRVWPWFAAAVYALSLAVFAIIGVDLIAAAPSAGDRPPSELLWLIPTITFGFLLCPYLDLTFHRALRESPSRHAFAVFGITFVVMLALTCAYRDVLTTKVSWLVFAHLAAQSTFTMAAHVRELRASPVSEAVPVGSAALVLLTLLALPIVFVTSYAASPVDAGVELYLRFLAFYGLIFPAYVLFAAARGGSIGWSRQGAVFFVLGMVIALPFYEAGFIHHWTWLLPIPLVGMLIAARVIRRGI